MPKNCIILQAPVENVIAEAMVHFDANEQTRISLSNRQYQMSITSSGQKAVKAIILDIKHSLDCDYAAIL
ncbi:predicted protein [Botrytis cinerea T4]|uniref:Uncharacterized protein n=1 Tax=Botryotinia fuckeliana (strain T4) TaxID=999810 RepID=G2XW65_BOTF4|nr:predicted protein [Botrytis cinerea T4]